MVDNKKTPFSAICRRLSKAIDWPVDNYGLGILLYGWRCHEPAVAPAPNVLSARASADGERWLDPIELGFFSLYCGYDLTREE